MNTVDRWIRVPLFFLFTTLMFKIYDDMILSILAGVLGLYCILTAIFDSCIVYNFLDINTRTSKKKDRFY